MAGNAGGPRWAKPHNCQFNCALFIYYMTQSIRFRFLEQDMVSDVVLVCTSLLPHSIYMPLGQIVPFGSTIRSPLHSSQGRPDKLPQDVRQSLHCIFLSLFGGTFPLPGASLSFDVSAVSVNNMYPSTFLG